MIQGLAQLPDSVDVAKARLARRLLLAGHHGTNEAFERRGLQLSPGDRSALDSWIEHAVPASVDEEHRAADGSEKLRVRLGDDLCVETVVMPDDSVCVSTQVGCAVGCSFCASGLDGLRRNLSATEILAQVVLARRRRPTISRLVYMGIGEPSHNLAAVCRASAVLADDGGLPGRRQTFSTVGSPLLPGPLLDLAERPNLAISMHSLDDGLRAQLVPRGGRVSVGELLELGEGYAKIVDRKVQYAWTLLDGVNCGPQDVQRWIEVFVDRRAFVNVIPWNPSPELPFHRPSHDRAVEIVRELRAAGVVATVRHSLGADAVAACGQLRSRSG